MPSLRQPVAVGQQPEAVTVRQQPEAVVEPVQQLRNAERVHPRRRQLDGERHPVQPGHQPRRQCRSLLIEHESSVGPPCPVREQRHRLALRRSRQVLGIRQRQRA